MCIHRFLAVKIAYLLPAANEVAVMLLQLCVSHSVHWGKGGLHAIGFASRGVCIQGEGLHQGGSASRGSASRGRPASRRVSASRGVYI